MDAVIFILEALVVLGAIIMGTRLRRSTGSAAECLQRHPPVEAGSGGSIPLLRTLQTAAPQAEFILWGPEDVARARIHASDESVDPSEIERLIVSQAQLIQLLATKPSTGSSTAETVPVPTSGTR